MTTLVMSRFTVTDLVRFYTKHYNIYYLCQHTNYH
jgi:hypothetical protein